MEFWNRLRMRIQRTQLDRELDEERLTVDTGSHL